MLKVKQDMTPADSLLADDIAQVYAVLLDALTDLSRRGNRFAAREIIRTMTRQNIDLCEVGYMVTDDGGITKITQESIDTIHQNETQLEKLQRRFRETGNPQILNDIILLMENG